MAVVIYYIIYDSQKMPPSLPVAIIATFNSYIGTPFLPGLDTSVPICPVTIDWHSQNTKLARRMLPIILGYALSIHKLQGDTSERLIPNTREKEFAVGLLLVAVARGPRRSNDSHFSPSQIMKASSKFPSHKC